MTKRAQTAVSLLPLLLLPALAYWLARWGWDWLWEKRPLALIIALSGVNVALLILFFRIWWRGAQRWVYFLHPIDMLLPAIFSVTILFLPLLLYWFSVLHWGVTAVATVTSLEVVAHEDADGHRTTSHTVHYTFTTADGRRYASSDGVPPEVYATLENGGRVMVRYLTALPRLSRPDTPQILRPLGIYLLWWNLVGLFWLSGATVSTRWRS